VKSVKAASMAYEEYFRIDKDKKRRVFRTFSLSSPAAIFVI
jgi:hypothetical protein